MSFLETKYLYFFLLIFSMAYPLAQSFEKRIQLYKKFKYLGLGVIAVMIIFIPWDMWFTQQGVWWFNDEYTAGVNLYNLPIEEVLFFVFIPYACVFIYEVLNYFVKANILGRISRPFFGILAIALFSLAFVHSENLYTLVCFISTGIAVLILVIVNPKWIGSFLLAYLVSLIPLLLVNGILTGSLIESPVVNYSPDAIIGLRIISIPIEDFIYNLLMFLIMIATYEKTNSIDRLKS